MDCRGSIKIVGWGAIDWKELQVFFFSLSVVTHETSSEGLWDSLSHHLLVWGSQLTSEDPSVKGGYETLRTWRLEADSRKILMPLWVLVFTCRNWRKRGLFLWALILLNIRSTFSMNSLRILGTRSIEFLSLYNPS